MTSEPSDAEIREYMADHSIDFYNARERLREQSYGGVPPNGFQSWGDYWKSF